MDAYIGEIRAFGFPYAPQGWLACNGQQLMINQYTTLFAILGVNYGGDAKTYFNLPNLAGNALVGGPSALGQIGQSAGSESIALTLAQMAMHNHNIQVINRAATTVTTAMTNKPANNVYLTQSNSTTPPVKTIYGYADGTTSPTVALNMNAMQPTGIATPHENRMPFVAMNYCICWDGLWPSKP